MNQKKYEFFCEICGKPGMSSLRKTKLHTGECQRLKAKQNRKKSGYPYHYQTPKAPEIVLVDSICPKCRKKHKAETKWAFCPKHEFLRYETNYFEIQHGVVAP
jgi:hypothetical protein